MIALPFATPPPPAVFNYRLLMNQFDEELQFTLVDKAVPNRGISRNGAAMDTDQLVVTLDYEQRITQIAADDFPVSGKAGDPGLAIHHEPGLWLHMINETTNGINIARLATIPHGDSALALGQSAELNRPPQISPLNGLPIGVGQDFQNNPYLAPYKHFIDTPFFGTVPTSVPGFPGFNPLDLNAILSFSNNGVNIVKTTKLEVDTTIEDAGIVNIPFIVRQANASSMKSTFWIEELAEQDDQGNPKLRLQYSQVVILDFFDRRDGLPGRILWPHVSINTLEKVSEVATYPSVGRLITNLVASSGNPYQTDTLSARQSTYTDRGYTFTTVPSVLDNQEFIRTANNDKGATNPDFLTFTLTADATVYVLFDDRATLPAWLNDGTWTPTGDTVGTTDVTRNVYQKRFSAGTVQLGGNAMAPMSGSNSMYNVVAV
jgi:hypothetical protein